MKGRVPDAVDGAADGVAHLPCDSGCAVVDDLTIGTVAAVPTVHGRQRKLKVPTRIRELVRQVHYGSMTGGQAVAFNELPMSTSKGVGSGQLNERFYQADISWVARAGFGAACKTLPGLLEACSKARVIEKYFRQLCDAAKQGLVDVTTGVHGMFSIHLAPTPKPVKMLKAKTQWVDFFMA